MHRRLFVRHTLIFSNRRGTFALRTVTALREVEIVLAQGASAAEACRRIAVSEQT
jgi:hypothetical protein